MADEPLSFADLVARDNAAADAAAASTATSTPPAATSEPTVADAALETSSADAQAVEATPAGETSPEAEAEAKPQETSDDSTPILQYAAELLGAPEWIKKYKTDEDMLRGVAELQSLIGKQARDVATLRRLEEMGLTPQEVVRWMSQRNQPPESPNPAAPAEDWNPAWVAKGKDGKVYPTAGAPADWEQRFERYTAKVQDAILDPAKLWDLVKPYASQELQKTTEKTREEIEQQRIADHYETAKTAWLQQHSGVIYDDSGAMTPHGQRMKTLLEETDPEVGYRIPIEWPPHKRYEQAHRLALLEQPKPKPKITPPAAKRIAQPAVAPPKKLSGDEWTKANPTASLRELAAAVERGEVTLA